jgi:hypothetical protein
MTDTTYIGRSQPEQCEYEVSACNGGTVIPLSPRLDLRNHSPTGLSWGYPGSGPAQLALALLADATGKDEVALRFYQKYKAEVVAKLPKDWELPISAVSGWVRRQIDGRDPDPTREGIFQNHNCWKCRDGELPCAQGAPHRCEYPHARND